MTTDLKPSELSGYVKTATGLTVPAVETTAASGTITPPITPPITLADLQAAEEKDPNETPVVKRGRVLGYFPASDGAVVLTDARTVAAVKKILESQPAGMYTILEVVWSAEVCEETFVRKVCK